MEAHRHAGPAEPARRQLVLAYRPDFDVDELERRLALLAGEPAPPAAGGPAAGGNPMTVRISGEQALSRQPSAWQAGRPAQAPASAGWDLTPHLLAEAFAPIPGPALDELGQAFGLLRQALRLSADLPAAGAAGSLGSALRIQGLQLAACARLRDVLPARSAFWPALEQSQAAAAAALLRETDLAAGREPWERCDQAACLAVAAGKRSLDRALIAGLAALSGDERPAGALLAALAGYQVALQALDDLLGWRTDAEHARPSLLTLRLFSRPPRWAGRPSGAALSRLARRIYYDHHASAVIQFGLEALDRAELRLAGLPAGAWRAAIAELRRCLQELLRDIYRIVHQNLRRVARQPELRLAPPLARTPVEQLLWDGVQFLLSQWRLGFGEARRIGRFARRDGFSALGDHQAGDVFERALIAEALCDADRLLGGQLRPALDYETEYVLSRQDRAGIPGWRRYPELPELPPDADTLAQVIQLLARRPPTSAPDRCDEELAALLRDQLRPDGACDTWLIPDAGRSAEQERQAALVGRVWSSEPDCAVLANLLYALLLCPPQRGFEREPAGCKRGLYYLEACQEPDGSWRSGSYAGPFYPTWLAVRLLARTRPSSPALERARQFLRRRQHGDGGWGVAGVSDAASGALALLGLLAAGLGRDDAAIQRGLAALIESQEADDGWPAAPILNPDQAGQARQASRAVTAALVIKALAAWIERGARRG